MIENSSGSLIKGTILERTDKAVKMKVDTIAGIPSPDAGVLWFPLSQIDKIFSGSTVEGEDSFVCTDWLLDRKGLI